MEVTPLFTVELTWRKIPRLTDCSSPVEALSYNSLWENVDFKAFVNRNALESTLDKMKKVMGSSNKCRIHQYILSIGVLRSHNLSAHWKPPDLLSILHSTVTPYLSSPCAESTEFVQLLQLAKECDDIELQQIVTTTWLRRIRNRELSPIPAILIADDLGHRCRDFLSSALYEYLLLVESQISSSQNIDKGSLSPNQILRVLEGYHSLSTCCSDLFHPTRPLTFTHDTQCCSHDECLSTWRSRWSVCIMNLSIQGGSSSSVDVLGRLVVVFDILSADRSLNLFMTEACRENALQAVIGKREYIVLNLHHYFDL